MTTAVTARLYADGRIGREETTVMCITGNGLKTTDVLAGRFETAVPVRPRLADFDAYIRAVDGGLVGAEAEELVLAGGVQ